MASKSIDWDELLLTNDPKKKEIEVSFKKIDGEGYISFGDPPGTPPVTEGPDGGQPDTDDEGDFPADEDPTSGGGPIDGENPECGDATCASWDAYEAAVNEMVQRTSTEYAPWDLVEGNNKRYARVKVIRTLVERLEERLAK